MGILNEVFEYRNTGLWLLSNFDNFDNLILFPSPFHISKLATGGQAVATSRLGAGIGKTRPAPTKHMQTDKDDTAGTTDWTDRPSRHEALSRSRQCTVTWNVATARRAAFGDGAASRICLHSVTCNRWRCHDI